MLSEEEETHRFLTSMVSVGSKVLGGASGVLAAYATGMPIAAALTSPFVAHQLEKGGKHLIDSKLAPRQEARVGAAYVMAHQMIADRLGQGERPRGEAFFSNDASGRSAADEVTEAALAAARDAAEERKIPFIAHLLAYSFFDGAADHQSAHFLISTAERLSYRAYANMDAALSETMNLITSGLVVARARRSDINTLAVLGPNDIQPQKLQLSSLGQALFEALNLDAMDTADAARVSVRRIFSYVALVDRGSTVQDSGEF